MVDDELGGVGGRGIGAALDAVCFRLGEECGMLMWGRKEKLCISEFCIKS